MTQLPFERTFRDWCGRSNTSWRTVRYARPEAGGEAEGHVLSPAGRDILGRVLVVHGAGNDALFSLTSVFESLLRGGMEVFTFDVDGHGRHSSTVLSPTTADSIVPAALEAAWGHRPLDTPLHGIGVSLGGALLLHALPRIDPPFASASLLSAPLEVRLSWRTIRRELGPPMLRTLWRERDRFGLTGLIPACGPFRRGLDPLRLAETPPPGVFGYVSVINSLLRDLDLESAARGAEGTPVLLVYGERDLLVSPAQARRLAELLPTSELMVLPGETHLSAPLCPVALTRATAWIASHPPLGQTAP